MGRLSQILIDTSIFIDHLRKQIKADTLLTRAIHRFDDLFISVITVYEVDFGAERKKRESDITPFLSDVTVIPIDIELAKLTAHLHAMLISQNKDIGFRDTIIAASALRLNLPILTLNQSHFSRVMNLKLVDVNSLA